MISISLKTLAENLIGYAWWISFGIVAAMIIGTLLVAVCNNYNTRDYWPKKAMQIMIMGTCRSWFHVILLIANIMFCLQLIVGSGYSWWLMAVPPISFPLSGIILTWATRLCAIVGWVVSKTIENYLKIFRKNWF